MTGIAKGLIDMPKIAKGSTEILKVSKGDTLVWPGGIDHLDYHNSSGVNSQNYNFSGLTPVKGDLLYYSRWLASSAAITDSTPAGWTKLFSQIITPSNQVMFSAFYCIYDPAIHGTSISAPTSNIFYSHGCIVFRGKSSANTVTQITSVQVQQGTVQLSSNWPTNVTYNQNTGLGGKTGAFVATYCADGDIEFTPIFTGATPISPNFATFLPNRAYVGNATKASITIGLQSGQSGISVAGMQYTQFLAS